MHSYFTRSKVMSHHNSLHDGPLQEAGSTGLNKINLPSKVTIGKHPNLALIQLSAYDEISRHGIPTTLYSIDAVS